jgi:hypothetical protein
LVVFWLMEQANLNLETVFESEVDALAARQAGI